MNSQRHGIEKEMNQIEKSGELTKARKSGVMKLRNSSMRYKTFKSIASKTQNPELKDMDKKVLFAKRLV